MKFSDKTVGPKHETRSENIKQIIRPKWNNLRF